MIFVMSAIDLLGGLMLIGLSGYAGELMAFAVTLGVLSSIKGLYSIALSL